MDTTTLAQDPDHPQHQIISAAHRLFLQSGYHGTSMRQIARETGMALGGIYNHFQNKDEIFRAVLMTYHPYHFILAALQDARGEEIGDLLRDAAYRMVANLEGRPDFVNLLFIELVEFRGAHVRELFESFYPSVWQFAVRLFADQDQLRPIPVHVLLRTFIGLFFSYVMTELLLVNVMPQDMRQYGVDDFVDIFLHGVLRDTGGQ